MTIEQRIEEIFDGAIESRRAMDDRLRGMRDIEEEVKIDHREDWEKAKNSETRRTLLLEWINEDMQLAESYHNARRVYDAAREDYRVAQLDIKRLELLVAAGAR